MKLGTHVRLPDGRIGTVCFNSITGVGIRWGRVMFSEEEAETIMHGNGGLFGQEIDGDTLERISPQAMLREHSESLEKSLGLPCVGEDFEVLE